MTTQPASLQLPPPRLPPPRDRLHQPVPHLTLTSDRVLFTLITFGQLLIWRSQLGKAESAAHKMWPLAVAALTSLGMFCSLLLPQFFSRNRAWLIPCFRLVVLLVPSARATKVGSALILEREPVPGLAGVLVDLARLASGTRVILLAVQGTVQVLPPLSALVTQVAAAALTWNSRAYCDTALMTHPLTRQRIAHATAALELGASLPASAAVPFGGQLMLHPAGMAGASPPEAACRAFVSWFHVAGGILLPFLVSIHCWQQSPAAASNLPGDPQLRGRWRATAAAAAACADAGLHGAVVGTAFATWHCLALAWLGAKAGAGLLA